MVLVSSSQQLPRLARLRRLTARAQCPQANRSGSRAASLVFPTGCRALRGICVCVRIFCLRLSSHFCTGSLVDASVPGGAGRAGRAAVQPWPGEGPHKGEKRLHGRLYAGCAAGRSREAGVQGAGALGPVRRNRGGCALFRGRRGGARSDRRKPEEDDHQHLRAGRRDGRRRDDPPYRDRKRGGKHARRRRGTPFSGARIFAPPGIPQVTGRHCRHFVCEGPVRALGHAGKGAGPGEPVHARRDVRAGSLPRPGTAGGF